MIRKKHGMILSEDSTHRMRKSRERRIANVRQQIHQRKRAAWKQVELVKSAQRKQILRIAVQRLCKTFDARLEVLRKKRMREKPAEARLESEDPGSKRRARSQPLPKLFCLINPYRKSVRASSQRPIPSRTSKIDRSASKPPARRRNSNGAAVLDGNGGRESSASRPEKEIDRPEKGIGKGRGKGSKSNLSTERAIEPSRALSTIPEDRTVAPAGISKMHKKVQFTRKSRGKGIRMSTVCKKRLGPRARRKRRRKLHSVQKTNFWDLLFGESSEFNDALNWGGKGTKGMYILAGHGDHILDDEEDEVPSAARAIHPDILYPNGKGKSKRKSKSSAAPGNGGQVFTSFIGGKSAGKGSVAKSPPLRADAKPFYPSGLFTSFTNHNDDSNSDCSSNSNSKGCKGNSNDCKNAKGNAADLHQEFEKNILRKSTCTSCQRFRHPIFVLCPGQRIVGE